MTPEDGLLLAIRENLEDDLPRLAYADWLEEMGELDHAEFIRVECALAGMSQDDPDRRRLFRRDLTLLAAHKEEWFGPLRRFCSFWETRRGFLDELAITATEFLRYAPATCSRQALRYLRMGVEAGEVAEVARCPYLNWVRRLELSGPGLGDDLAEALAESPYLTWVERLQFYQMGMGPRGARALAASEGLPRLKELLLPGSELGAEGIEALLLSPSLPNLRHLNLTGRRGAQTDIPNIGNEGVIRLADCPRAIHLRSLDLFFNDLHDRAVLALARSPYLVNLESLGLVLSDRNGPEARQALNRRLGSRLHDRFWW